MNDESSSGTYLSRDYRQKHNTPKNRTELDVTFKLMSKRNLERCAGISYVPRYGPKLGHEKLIHTLDVSVWMDLQSSESNFRVHIPPKSNTFKPSIIVESNNSGQPTGRRKV